MNNLYRRIVTMGMISFSAILAWVYCVLAYREKTVYVVCLSLVLVISLYALLNSIISLHLSKQDDMKKYITDTINATLANLVPDQAERQAEKDRAIEAERLAKATYVQLRKVNQNLTQLAEANSYNSIKSIDNYTALTLSLKEAVTESIANTAKIIIKYNKTDNQNIIDVLNELTSKMQNITQALDDISTRIDSINIVAQPQNIITNPPEDTTPDITEEEEDIAVNSFFEEFEEKQEEPTEEITEDSNKMLTPDEIEALFQAAMPTSEVEPEPEPVNDDPNRQLTPDEIAALFSAAAPASEPEPVVEEDKIIPFPVNEEPEPEEPAPIAEEFDPNKQLSADEIAALFASINGGN